ncbi:MAG TPA: helix-turn-helix domain-containing protein [Chloroflexota bacterium]|nr:helix-turn-helix domain-containing protein [Chloroflexota bacterium]
MPTLGQTLRSTREGKRMKLSQVAEKTRIPLERLQALESDRYFDLPDDAYMRGAIRNYAIFLGLDPAEMETLYRQARPAEEKRVPLSVATTSRQVAVVPVAVGSVVLVVLILVILVLVHVIVL